jgi:hypothetical protein
MQINLKQEYQKWLKKMRLDESQMSEVQKRETKRAWFGGMSTFIVLTVSVDLPENEDDAVKVIEDIMRQTAEYWAKELMESIDSVGKIVSMYEKKPD